MFDLKGMPMVDQLMAASVDCGLIVSATLRLLEAIVGHLICFSPDPEEHTVRIEITHLIGNHYS